MPEEQKNQEHVTKTVVTPQFTTAKLPAIADAAKAPAGPKVVEIGGSKPAPKPEPKPEPKKAPAPENKIDRIAQQERKTREREAQLQQERAERQRVQAELENERQLRARFKADPAAVAKELGVEFGDITDSFAAINKQNTPEAQAKREARELKERLSRIEQERAREQQELVQRRNFEKAEQDTHGYYGKLNDTIYAEGSGFDICAKIAQKDPERFTKLVDEYAIGYAKALAQSEGRANFSVDDLPDPAKLVEVIEKHYEEMYEDMLDTPKGKTRAQRLSAFDKRVEAAATEEEPGEETTEEAPAHKKKAVFGPTGGNTKKTPFSPTLGGSLSTRSSPGAGSASDHMSLAERRAAAIAKYSKAFNEIEE
jgi:hypothetical protein